MVISGNLVLLVFVAAAPDAAQQSMTVDDIVRPNAATWDAIYAVDMQYEMHVRAVEDGNVKLERSVSGLRWSVERDIERLTLRDVDGRGRVEDYFLDGKSAKSLTYPLSTDLTKVALCDRKGVRAYERPIIGKMLVDKRPQVLRYVTLLSEGTRLTLGELARKWKVSVEGKFVKDGDTLWRLRAVYLPTKEEDDRAGSQMDLLVNSAKGFLIQQVDVLDTAVARPVGGENFVPVHYSTEVTAYKDCGNGTYFPQVVELRNRGQADPAKPTDGYYVTFRSTSLLINTPIPEDALAFRYPINVPVEVSTGGGQQAVKYYLQESEQGGPTRFGSAKELDDYISKHCERDVKVSRPPASRSWLFRAISLGVAAFFLGVLWLIRKRR